MRWRLLVVLLTFAALAIAGFVVPLLTSTATERTERLHIDRSTALDRFAVLAQQALATGDRDPLIGEVTAYAQLYGEDVLIVDRQLRSVVTVGGLALDDPQVRPVISGALRNESGPPLSTLWPWSSGKLVLARPVGIGPRIAGVVVLRTSIDAAAADIGQSWLLIGMGTLVVAAGFVWLALRLARWVLRPLAELERGVLAVTEGRRGAHVPTGGGPPELQELTASFNRMSDAVAEATERERRLVADASHQLRNPMAALRLRFDALAPSVPVAAQANYRSLAVEVERLESLLDGLLTLSLADGGAAEPDPDDGATCRPITVATARVDAWRHSARHAGIALVNQLTDRSAVACADKELAQVFDILLDNAIRYAGRGATVTLRAVTDPDTAQLIVEDDGPGLSAEERIWAPRRFWRAPQHSDSGGTGLGLAIAVQLLAARHGSLHLMASERGGLAARITLPRAGHPVRDR